jgi:hypothetical protein
MTKTCRPLPLIRRVLLLVVLAALLLAPLTACAKKETSAPGESSTAAAASEETTAATQPVKEIAGYKPINGLPVFRSSAVSARPVAIMINNIKVATPQKGIGAADLLYEIEVKEISPG